MVTLLNCFLSVLEAFRLYKDKLIMPECVLMIWSVVVQNSRSPEVGEICNNYLVSFPHITSYVHRGRLDVY